MSLRKRLAFFLIFLLVAGALDALCAPFVVAQGVRLWLRWAGQRQGLRVEMESVDAPFLRPVTIRQLRLAPARDDAPRVNLRAGTVVLDLNLGGWLLGRETALLHAVEVEHLVASLRPPPHPSAIRNLDWRQFGQLIPENFRLGAADIDFVAPTLSLRLRGLMLSGSAIESGKFLVRELDISSPLLRQSFHNLRGATSWESARLTIAGIPLARGLDLEALTFDFSHLPRRRVGVDLHLDTYGGTLRASFEGRAREKFMLEVAGSAANISLAQISQAFGFLEPISGSVRASKFTFRGNPGEFLDATASVWVELTDFSWRERRANSVMLGATYYDRRLEVEQLYVRQRQNEVTINGELLWPKKQSGWMQLPFRGQINASIPDLNGFAQLFGATTGDFTGALLAEGNLDSLAPEAHGQIAFHGQEVKFRGVALDSLGGNLQLNGSEVKLDRFEARRVEDFLRAEGTIDLAGPHRFSGRLTGALNDLAAYAPLLPADWPSGKIGGGATFDWRGDGTLAAHSGTMQFVAHGLQLPVATLRRPLDVTLEGSYSPRDVFFRTFKVANERVSLGGFLMLGSNFVELQALQFSLDGTPRASGTLFLPFSPWRWLQSRSLLAALDAEQKFDVDLVIDDLDLGGLANALGEESSLTGVLRGKLAVFGPLASLQATTNWRLARLGAFRTSNAIEFDGRYAEGRADAEVRATFGVSSPLQVIASLPLDLDRVHLQSGTVLDRTAPLYLGMDCPALFLEDLPNELRFRAESGLLSGKANLSGSLEHPVMKGEAQIFAGRFRPPPPWPGVKDLTARVEFQKWGAVIDPLRFEINGTPLQWQGRLRATSEAFELTLRPVEQIIELADEPAPGRNLSTIRLLGEGGEEDAPHLVQAFVRGKFGAGASLTISSAGGREAVEQQRTVFLDRPAVEGSPLLLRVLRPAGAPEELRLGGRPPQR